MEWDGCCDEDPSSSYLDSSSSSDNKTHTFVDVVSSLIVALIFIFVTIGFGYLTHPFLDRDWAWIPAIMFLFLGAISLIALIRFLYELILFLLAVASAILKFIFSP